MGDQVCTGRDSDVGGGQPLWEVVDRWERCVFVSLPPSLGIFVNLYRNIFGRKWVFESSKYSHTVTPPSPNCMMEARDSLSFVASRFQPNIIGRWFVVVFRERHWKPEENCFCYCKSLSCEVSKSVLRLTGSADIR